MQPALLNLPDIWRARIWPTITLIWKDQDGNAMDLTNWTPIAKTSSGTNLNATVTDPVNGVTTLSLNQGQTALIRSLGVQQWNWVWIDNTGKPYPPFLYGTVIVMQDVITIPVPA